MRFSGTAENWPVAPPCMNRMSCELGTESRLRSFSLAPACISWNRLPRWLISITDIPLECQFMSSAWAFFKTGAGSCAGPAAKLYIFPTIRNTPLNRYYIKYSLSAPPASNSSSNKHFARDPGNLHVFDKPAQPCPRDGDLHIV